MSPFPPFAFSLQKGRIGSRPRRFDCRLRCLSEISTRQTTTKGHQRLQSGTAVLPRLGTGLGTEHSPRSRASAKRYRPSPTRAFSRRRSAVEHAGLRASLSMQGRRSDGTAAGETLSDLVARRQPSTGAKPSLRAPTSNQFPKGQNCIFRANWIERGPPIW